MMDQSSPESEIIARFGSAIGQLHQDRVTSIERLLKTISAPESEYEHTIAAYYTPMDRDRLVVAIAQGAIEGILHDLFFLFDEQEDFKLVLQAADGTQVNLADAVDEIKAFPFDWIEEKSKAGFEIGRKVDFIQENLPRETDQERRARLIRERAQARSNDQS